MAPMSDPLVKAVGTGSEVPCWRAGLLFGCLLSGTSVAATGERIDAIHQASEDLVQKLASSVDGFFVSDEFATFEDNDTRVRLRLNLDHLENDGWDLSPKVKINLQLPGLSERLSLVMNDGDSDDSEDPTDDDSDENDLALRWMLDKSNDSEIKFDLGLRLEDGSLDPFARLNLNVEYPVSEDWRGRTSNRIYYYSKTGLRNDLRQYFDRRFDDKTLLRSRTRIEYLAENDYNPHLEQRFSLFRTFGERSAIAFEVLWNKESYEDSNFHDEALEIRPQKTYQQYEARVRYRRRTWRPWLYLEIWPLVQWAEEREWESLLGFRARLEVNLGSSGTRQLDE